MDVYVQAEWLVRKNQQYAITHLENKNNMSMSIQYTAINWFKNTRIYSYISRQLSKCNPEEVINYVRWEKYISDINLVRQSNVAQGFSVSRTRYIVIADANENELSAELIWQNRKYFTRAAILAFTWLLYTYRKSLVERRMHWPCERACRIDVEAIS